ncbi:hypothetical protein [Endozoicomonas ascidiicola]|uniref:hypothetical protein n=1 Tax=Endozoicomonas ascidiicola TaxID=1698521 RepID=UPI00082D4AD8|nr:hypothetical protein [Endozoicomonas ascidiicola]
MDAESKLKWRLPHGRVPDGWIERHADMDDYVLKVWFSSGGFFEGALVRLSTGSRFRLHINATELDDACREAGKRCIQLIAANKA